jgi:hypothetical protein
MSENLLTPSVVKLFGRTMSDLLFQFDPNTVVRGFNNLLERQLYANGSTVSISNITGTAHYNSQNIDGLSSTSGLLRGMSISAVDSNNNSHLPDGTVIIQVGPGAQIIVNAISDVSAGDKKAKVSLTAAMLPQFARIYAFTFEGAYCPLPRPPILLVHGNGIPINSPQGSWSNFETAGVMGREWDFSASDHPKATSDLRYWEYEKSDFSIRLDPEAGPLEQILLAAALRAGADMADRATGIRSGASLSGASLSGASLSGASVSGASLSGASLSGASLRR